MKSDFKNIASRLYCRVPNSTLWKLQAPKFDYSTILHREIIGGFRNEFITFEDSEIEQYAIQQIGEKYPKLPSWMGLAIYTAFIKETYKVDLRYIRFPFTKATKYSFQQYLLEKIAQYPGTFPFYDAIPFRWRLLYETYYGLNYLFYDLYMPITLLQKGASVEKPLHAMAKYAPTVLYEKPFHIPTYYPLGFILSFPFFTVPRKNKGYLLEDVDASMSVLDIFGTESIDHQIRNDYISNINLIENNIDYMFNSEPLVANYGKKSLNRYFDSLEGKTPQAQKIIRYRAFCRNKIANCPINYYYALLADLDFYYQDRTVDTRIDKAEQINQAILADVRKLYKEVL